MAERQTRTFEISKAVRKAVPLLVGLTGASSSGKTVSALRLAKGMQRITGGKIGCIDTEHKRALHYADKFDFQHIPFTAPFSPLDYIDVIRQAAKAGLSILIVDSASHEHEGPGGVLDWHEKELDRLAGSDEKKRERMTWTAWAAPKAARRKLINEILQLGVSAIFCFRAKEKIKIVRGQQPISLGWMPIAGEEWVFEMTVNFLLYPGSSGMPTWQTEMPGERQMMKLPTQFKGLFQPENHRLDESIGEALATWAKGGAAVPSKEDDLAEKPDAPKVDAPEDAEGPCWESVEDGRCKLVKGHAGNHVPE